MNLDTMHATTPSRRSAGWVEYAVPEELTRHHSLSAIATHLEGAHYGLWYDRGSETLRILID